MVLSRLTISHENLTSSVISCSTIVCCRLYQVIGKRVRKEDQCMVIRSTQTNIDKLTYKVIHNTYIDRQQYCSPTAEK